MAKHYPVAFKVGDPTKEAVDFAKEEIDKWTTQIEWWVAESQPNEEDRRGKAEKIMAAALNGTKINGEVWPGVHHFSLRSRIRQLCGWDIEKGVGQSSSLAARKKLHPQHPLQKNARETRKQNSAALQELSMAEMVARRDEFKELLLQQFPWLDNPVYELKVNALAEAEVKLESLSDQFLSAGPRELKHLLEIKQDLRKDINELMEMLSIHPKQLKDRVDETDRGDVGTLIAKWEEMGVLSEEYERVDAIQELIQAIRSAHNLRVDGSPQLADYLLWHRTGCAGHYFRCKCGETYELYRGFTLEELEEAAMQAYKMFGWGLKRKTVESKDGDDGGRETTQTADAEV